MRKFLQIASLVAIWCICTFAVKANHLDGLWRNERENITIRIATTDQGIKTKRLDQGVWYFYTQRGNEQYVDRQGNYYEIWDNDELAWREVGSRKTINFVRVDDNANRNADQWDDDRYNDRYNDRNEDREDNNCRDHGNGNSQNGKHRNNQSHGGTARNTDWNHDDHWNDNDAANLSGNWINQSRKQAIRVESFRNGVRVTGSNGRTEEFTDRDRNGIFQSRNGDTISLINAHTLQWKNANRGRSVIFQKDNRYMKNRHFS